VVVTGLSVVVDPFNILFVFGAAMVTGARVGEDLFPEGTPYATTISFKPLR
jgi:hypothetical protein